MTDDLDGIAEFHVARGWREIWLHRNAQGKIVPAHSAQELGPGLGSTGLVHVDHYPRTPDSHWLAIAPKDGSAWLDVDQYDDKHGWDSIRALEAELGPLPATHRITSRPKDNPSGKYMFQVPLGFLGRSIPDVEMIDRHVRWTWAPDTKHPKTGTEVIVWHPSGYRVNTPWPSQLTQLPPAWVEYFSVRQDKPMTKLDIEIPDDGGMCSEAMTVIERMELDGASATGERAFKAVMYLKNRAAEGHRVGGVIEKVRSALLETTDRDWEEMWQRAPVEYEGPPDEGWSCCYDILPAPVAGLAVPAVQPFTPAQSPPYAQQPLQAPQPVLEPVSRFTRRKASTIEAKAVPWLYEPYVVRGALNLLAGYEGDGKSTLTAGFVANVTRGTFNGSKGPETVLTVCTEDAWEYTIVPRLLAAGADLTRVEILVPADGMPELTFPQDCTGLEAEIVACGAALLVLDPLLSRLTEKLDSHKDAEVRRGMEPLKSVLERTGCAALGLMHFNKSTASSNPLDRLMASRAWSAISRSTLAVVPHPEDEALRVLAHAKSNVGPKGSALPYRVVPSQPVPGSIPSSRVEFLTPMEEFFIGAAMDKKAARKNDANLAGEEAADWLSRYLREREGAALADEVTDAARANGISAAALKRGRQMCRVEVTPVLGMKSTWAWNHEGMEPGQVAVTLQHRAKLAAVAEQVDGHP